MWKDIDFKNKRIHIERALSCQYEEGNKMMRMTSPKTYNFCRYIPFFGETEDMLQKQKEKVEMLKKTLGSRWRAAKEYDLVFVTTMGSAVTRYTAAKEIDKIVKEINDQEAFDSVNEQREPVIFEHVYPHALRHTFCSRCFEARMEPKVVQSIMGHQHYETTIDIYTHVSDEMYEEEIKKFGNAVEEGEETNETINELSLG